MIKTVLAVIGVIAIVFYAFSWGDQERDVSLPNTVDEIQDSYNKLQKTYEHFQVMYDESKKIYHIVLAEKTGS